MYCACTISRDSIKKKKRNEPGCSTSSLSDNVASGTRFMTVSSDGEGVEDSVEDASESSSRTSAEPKSILYQLKLGGQSFPAVCDLKK